MSCQAACFAQIGEGTEITSHSQPNEIVFYFGADESQVLVFNRESLGEFLALATNALQEAQEKSALVVA